MKVVIEQVGCVEPKVLIPVSGDLDKVLLLLPYGRNGWTRVTVTFPNRREVFNVRQADDAEGSVREVFNLRVEHKMQKTVWGNRYDLESQLLMKPEQFSRLVKKSRPASERAFRSGQGPELPVSERGTSM